MLQLILLVLLLSFAHSIYMLVRADVDEYDYLLDTSVAQQQLPQAPGAAGADGIVASNQTVSVDPVSSDYIFDFSNFIRTVVTCYRMMTGDSDFRVLTQTR